MKKFTGRKILANTVVVFAWFFLGYFVYYLDLKTVVVKYLLVNTEMDLKNTVLIVGIISEILWIIVLVIGINIVGRYYKKKRKINNSAP